MSEVERLYTVEQVAKMTSLTTRTIQNYLRTGILRGRRIGGQWRFTATDIREMITGRNGSSEAAAEQRQNVIDFLDGVNTDIGGETQICTVIDLYLPREDAENTYNKLHELVESEKGENHLILQYSYADASQKARFLLFAPTALIGKAMEILK